MSLHDNDVCLLEVYKEDDYNMYEEEASDHAFSRSEKHSSGGKTMEAEKRIRREIANSNERRRMQSINAGFQALRTLLPRHEGEKLSKAAILQQTAEYIYSLEQEKTRLLSQNCQLKRLLNQHEGGEIPLKKRKGEVITHVLNTINPDSTEEVARSPDPVTVVTLTKKDQDTDVRALLEKEKRLRRVLEERLRAMEAQLYPSEAEESSESTESKADSVEIPKEVAPVSAAPLLEAAIKAEPSVEVEILPQPAHDTTSRLYRINTNTSRQNLETIVEAIRHLEGDHLFREPEPEAPLALTKKPTRPGVIVVKHS